MKKKILFSLLIIVSLNAESISNELGINMGLTSINNESGSRFNNYGMGINYQLNRFVVMPRFDLDYVKISDFPADEVDTLFKGSVNGVYEFENKTVLLPYGMGGFGYEHVSGEVKDVFESHFFIQAGLGVSYEFDRGYKAQIEGKMLQILDGNNENNEVILNLGMSFPLHRRVSKPKRVVKPIRVRKTVVRRVAPVRVRERVIKRVAPIQSKIVYIDNNKCPKKIAAPDRDRDGVRDAIDQCPNTPCDFSVDSYGCPVKTTLKVNFGVNSSRITDYSMPKVEKFAKFLLANRGSQVLIVGHTDSDGSSSSNLLLSQKRAYAVMNRLLQLGVSSSRIRAEGRGETMPIASNKTKEGKRLNRRIEAILIYPKYR